MYRTSICKWLLLSTVVGCSTPRHEVVRPWTRVSASTQRDAQHVSAVVSRFGAEVAEMLGVEQRPLQIEVFPVHTFHSDSGELYGAYDGNGRIKLSRNALGDFGHRVLHEVCHAYAEDIDWVQGMPAFLREGLAEHVSLTVSGETLPYRGWFEPQMRLGQRERLALWGQAKVSEMGEHRDAGYVYGFLLFEEFGIDALRSAFESGSVDPAEMDRQWLQGAKAPVPDRLTDLDR